MTIRLMWAVWLCLAFYALGTLAAAHTFDWPHQGCVHQSCFSTPSTP